MKVGKERTGEKLTPHMLSDDCFVLVTEYLLQPETVAPHYNRLSASPSQHEQELEEEVDAAGWTWRLDQWRRHLAQCSAGQFERPESNNLSILASRQYPKEPPNSANPKSNQAMTLALVCRRWNACIADLGIYFSSFSFLFPREVDPVLGQYRAANGLPSAYDAAAAAALVPWRTLLAEHLSKRFGRHHHSLSHLTASDARILLSMSRGRGRVGAWNQLVAVLMPRRQAVWELGGRQVMVTGPHPRVVQDFIRCAGAAAVGGHPDGILVQRVNLTIDGCGVCLHATRIESAVRGGVVEANAFLDQGRDTTFITSSVPYSSTMLSPSLSLDLVGVEISIHGTPLDHIFEDGLRGAVFLLDATADCFADSNSNGDDAERGGAVSEDLDKLGYLLNQKLVDCLPIVIVLLNVEFLAQDDISRRISLVEKLVKMRMNRWPMQIVSIFPASLLLPGSLLRALRFFNIAIS